MKLLAVLIILVLEIQLINCRAKKCYQCFTVGCDDPFNKNAFGVSTADSPTGWCYKTKRVEKGKTTISRNGFTTGTEKKCEKLSGSGVTTVTCWCDTDLCNTAPSSKSTITILFLSSFLVPLFFKHFY